MPKADIVLPDGTKITVDGAADEITKIVATLSPGRSLHAKAGTLRRRGSRRVAKSRAPAAGPTSYILELRDEGFFKIKRSLNEVQKKLEEKGHIYARTTLSPTLIKLVRRARPGGPGKELRRIKDGTRWAYVN